METIIDKIVAQQIKSIEAKRDEELLRRIKRYEPNVDLIREAQRIFPRIAMQREHDGTEKWYWNDDGHPVLVMIVKHFQMGDPITFNEDSNSFNLSMHVDFI